jgi:hypothetical protein
MGTDQHLAELRWVTCDVTPACREDLYHSFQIRDFMGKPNKSSARRFVKYLQGSDHDKG